MVLKSLGFGTNNLFSVTGTGNGLKPSGNIDVQTNRSHLRTTLHLTILN